MKNKLLDIVNFCKDKKLCSLDQAFELSRRFNSSEINAAVISRKDLSYINMIKFLEEIELNWVVRQAVVLRTDLFYSYEIICEYSLEKEPLYRYGVIVGFKYHYSEDLLEVMAEQGILTQFKFSEILDYLEKTSYAEYMILTLQNNKTWKNSSFKEKCIILEKNKHNSALAKLVIESSSCSLLDSIDLMKKTDDPVWVSHSLIEKSEFSVTDLICKLSIFFSNMIDFDFDSMWAIAHRKDCTSAQALEIMQKLVARQAEPDEIQEVAIAIVKKTDTSFELALQVARDFDYDISIVEAFQEREVFTIPERYELISVMDAHVPYMYQEKEEEPSYDSYDYGNIVEAADWSTGTLSEMFLLAQCGVARGKIMEREDWKNLSYEASLVLAKDVDYKYEVTSLILDRPYFNFRKSLKLLKKTNHERHHWWVLSAIVETSGCTFNQALSLLKYCSNNNDLSSILIKIAENSNFSLMQVSQIMLNGYMHQMNIVSAVYKHQGWALEPLGDVFKLLGKKIMYVEKTVLMITQRDDWKKLSFQGAQKYLAIGGINQDSLYFEHFLPTLLIKKDCSGKTAISLIAKIDFGKEFAKKLAASVIVKKDITLEVALGIAEKTLFGVFDQVVKRDDWQKISKKQFFVYLKKYKKISLYNSVAERDDWKKLSFHEALLFVDATSMDHFRYADYLALVISLKPCSLDQAIELAKQNNYAKSIIMAIILRNDCSLEKAVELATESKDCDNLIFFIFKQPCWKSTSVELALEIARRRFKNVHWYNTKKLFLEALSNLSSWITLSTRERLQVLEKDECIILL